MNPGLQRQLLVIAVSLLCAHDAFALSNDHTEWSAPVFNSAYKLIATEAELQELESLSTDRLPAFLDYFWKRRDPTPTTDTNEFRSEFEERVNFALDSYRTRSGRKPWDDRGDAYIRYGQPDERSDSVLNWYSPADTIQLNAVERNTKGSRVSRETTSMGRWLRNEHMRQFGELWYYFGRNLVLQFQGYNLEYELVPFVSLEGEYQPLAEFAAVLHRMETEPIRFSSPVGVTDLHYGLEGYCFRRTDGGYDVYVAGAAPLKQLLNFTTWQGGDINYKARVMAFDSTLATKWSDSVQVAQHFDVLPRGMLAQNQWETTLRPGFYVFTSEILDEAGKKHGVASFDRWLVPYLDSVELDLSPLVIAADVRDADANSDVFVHNGKEIIPMPGHVFKKDQDVAFYHEVYNLRPDEVGVCRYRIEYSIYKRKKDDKRTLLSKEFESSERQTFQAGRVPQRLLGKGSYILEVKTTDLHSNKTKTALAQFKVE